jgi:hypothetical protein
VAIGRIDLIFEFISARVCSFTFQLIVASVDWISRSIFSLDRITADSDQQTTRQEAAPCFDFGCLYKLIVEFILIPHSEGEFFLSKSEGAQAAPNHSNKLIVISMSGRSNQSLLNDDSSWWSS